jgi:hypothetical protein
MLRANRPSIPVKNKKKSSGLFVFAGLKSKKLRNIKMVVARETEKFKNLK